MITYELNNLYCKINPKHMCVSTTLNKNIDIMISNSLYYFFNKTKKQIDNNIEQWDYYKKLTNPYEFIHTPPFYNSQLAVSNYNAISRSFYKLIEMTNNFNLLAPFRNKSINTFHLAEGPGGFIEAMIHQRKNSSFFAHDKYHGITLQSKNRNIPKWQKLMNKFKNTKANITIENGKSGDGDLLKEDNFIYCFDKYKNSMDFLTGDGGFDFSLNYEDQEIMSLKLIYAQIMYAIIMQKQGGCFILKIFDIFYKPSLELIYVLNCFYKSVRICKPKTSRFANSEKYIICQDFIFEDTNNYFPCFLQNLKDFRKKGVIKSVLSIDLPLCFIQNIEEISAILGKKQIQIIQSTIMLMQEKRNEKIDRLRKKNIENSIKWCEQNNIPYQSSFKQKNIFTRI